MAHRIGDDHALHRVVGRALVEEPELAEGDHAERGLGDAIGDDAVLAGNPQVAEGDDARHHQEDGLREDGIDGLPVHWTNLGTDTWRSSSTTEVCMTSVRGFG